MNRRELLHAAGAAACVAVVPEVLDVTLIGETAQSSGWVETTTSNYMMARIKPLVEKFNQQKSVHSLTPDEWDELASGHGGYWNEHHRIGSLHPLDLEIRDPHSEVRLKERYNAAGVDYIVAHGSFGLLSQVPARLHQIAEKMRQEPYAPASLLSCDGVWGFAGIQYGIMGFLVPEIALFCLLMVVFCWLIEVATC